MITYNIVSMKNFQSKQALSVPTEIMLRLKQLKQ